MGRQPRQRQRRRTKLQEGTEPDPAVQADDDLFTVDKAPDANQQVDFGSVDDETRHYFKSIEARMDMNDWNSEEDMNIFLTNVYDEVVGKELVLTTDGECSVVLEKLLRLSSDLHLRVFFDKLSGNYVHLFRHFCASHVCQTIITLAADVLHREANNAFVDGAPEGLPTMTELVSNMCKQLRTFWLGLASDKHATFLVRAVLSILSGDEVATAAMRSRKSKVWSEQHNNSESTSARKGKRNVPPALIPVRDEVLEEVVSSFGPNARAYVFNPVTNPVLQQVLDLATDKELIIMKLIMQSSDDDSVPEEQRLTYVKNMITNVTASRLFEKVLQHCSSQTYQTIYTTHFRGQLKGYCKHSIANFVVQALIRNAKSSAPMELLLDELAPEFEDLLFRQRALIVYQFLELSHKYQNYRKVLKHFYRAVNAKTPKDLLPILLYLNRDAPRPGQKAESGQNVPDNGDLQTQRRRPQHGHGAFQGQASVHGAPISSPGNQIIQCILRMPNAHNKEVVDSYMANEMSWYHEFLKNPVASFTFQALISSPTVNLQPKRKLLFSLLNHTSPIDMSVLATEKFGSHIVDEFWKISDLDTKEKIAADLLPHEKRLQEAFYGRMVWRNCGMATFKKKREEWAQRHRSIEKKKEMFKGFLEGDKDGKLKELAFGIGEDAAGDEDKDGQDKEAVAMKAMVRIDDEIDQVFKLKTKKGLKADNVDFVKEDGTTKAKDKAMRQILEAIDATAKKRKKKAKKHSDDEGQEADGKRKKKKAKRQFAS